jgi:ATP-dependent helicase/nuclease subunit A
VLGADERDTVAAAAAVRSALAHPLMVRARDALAQGWCRREAPITLTLADGTIVEGVLDLAFREKDVWTVVDFKTDRELGGSCNITRDRSGSTLQRFHAPRVNRLRRS